jgi:hypothetical protein
VDPSSVCHHTTLSHLGSLQVPTNKTLITTDFYRHVFRQGIQTIPHHVLLCIEDQRHHIYKKKQRKTKQTQRSSSCATPTSTTNTQLQERNQSQPSGTSQLSISTSERYVTNRGLTPDAQRTILVLVNHL